MKLSYLEIKNFRNFENIYINLTNQNVLFGMNDVGKTNFLNAIRFLLDRDVRKHGFKETDFFQNDTSKEISITLTVDVSDREEDSDSQNIISKIGGARKSSNLESVLFRITGTYDQSEEVAIPELFWGSDIDNLEEVENKGVFSSIDKIFKVVYVDPTIDLENTFSKNRKKLFDQRKLSDNDIEISNKIKKIGKDLNNQIGNMEVIQSFQSMITEEYKKLKDEDIDIQMKSELTIDSYFNRLIPYIKKDQDDNLYPTSGDGRKKILAYSVLNHLIQEQEGNKIIIYLIEEPENSLHRSMQIALSKQLFNQKAYAHFFLSTHSSELLYEMDNASLIRIYSENKTNCASHIYSVEEQYKNIKKELNKSISSALFADKVLLVEGPSEKILFEKVLETVHPNYELDGGYILNVSGIKFEAYVSILNGLNIKTIIKTDNDLKAKRNEPLKFDVIGLNRCVNLLNMLYPEDQKPKLEPYEIDYSKEDENEQTVYDASDKNRMVKHKKKELFKENDQLIELLEEHSIFISEIDLENDLYNVISEPMTQVFGENPVNTLQDRKMINMIELTQYIDGEDCETIIEHDSFKSLKELVNR